MNSIKELADKIIEDGKITQEEYKEFLDAVHEDNQIDVDEKAQIERIYKLIKDGKVEIEGQ